MIEHISNSQSSNTQDSASSTVLPAFVMSGQSYSVTTNPILAGIAGISIESITAAPGKGAAPTAMDKTAINQLKKNPYDSTKLKLISQDYCPAIEHYRRFVKLGKRYGFLSRLGQTNFNVNLNPEQYRNLYQQLNLFVHNDNESIPFLSAHTRLLMACLLKKYADPTASSDRDVAAIDFVHEASLHREDYRMSGDLQAEMIVQELPTHRFREKEYDFWHLSNSLKQINPAVIIFGAGDITLRRVLPELFKAHQCRNSSGAAYLGAATEIIVIGNKKEASELQPRETPPGKTYSGLMTFPRYVEESCINMGIPLPDDLPAYRRFLGKIQYLPAYEDNGIPSDRFDKALQAACSRGESELFYPGVPPSQFAAIWKAIEPHLKFGRSIFMCEKPFGESEGETRQLTAMIERSSKRACAQVIDHYLGKTAIEFLLNLRRDFLEPFLNNRHVASVEINCIEDLGLGDRKYYDAVGAVTDMIQSHLLCLTALTALELPDVHECTAASFTDARLKLLRRIKPVEPKDCKVGQYSGYHKESKIMGPTNCPTYFAGKLQISDDPKAHNQKTWQGVDFYLRHGKKLDRKEAQIVINFKEDIYDRDCPRKLILTIQPKPRCQIWFRDSEQPEVLYPDTTSPSARLGDYGGLLLRALHFNPLSTCPEESLEQHRIVSKIIERGNMPLQIYDDGSNGPQLDHHKFHPFV